MFFMFRNQDRTSFLPETRKYKTNSSIPKESKEYKIFEDYIELEKILFCEKSRNQNIESLRNEITSIIERNPQKEKLLIQYLVGILIHFILIRPKETEVPCNLLSILLLKFSNLNDFIIQIIKNDESFKENTFIQDILYSQGIVKEEPIQYNIRQESNNSLNEKGKLEFILKEDDLEQLKDYINSRKNFSPKVKIKIYDDSFQNKLFGSHEIMKYNLLDFCSFYGSVQCFKFLKMNGFEYGEFIS